MRLAAIYILFDEFDNVKYIGKSVMPHQRCPGHKKSKPWLSRYSIIEWVDESEAGEREKSWIRYHRSIGSPLVNKTIGGQGISGRAHTPEAREKMRISHTGLKQSPETIQKRVAKTTGQKRKKWNDESRRKSSIAHLGRTPWNKGKKGSQVAWNKGLEASEESRKKNRKAHLGLTHTADAKEKCKIAGFKSADLRKKKANEKPIDSLVGQRFEKWTVKSLFIEYDEDHNRRIFYNCVCDCGTEKLIQFHGPKTFPRSKSCGCSHRDAMLRAQAASAEKRRNAKKLKECG